MKINLTTELTQLDGTPVPDTDGEPMTLRTVFCNVLTGQRQGENIPGPEKVRRSDLAIKIYNADEISLGIDDTKLLRDLVAGGYIPLIVGPVWHLLDPSTDGEE